MWSNGGMKHFYTVRGARVCAYVQGEGPNVLFLHGTGGNGKTWFNQLRRLSGEYRAIAVDLPGYGDSELPDSIESNDDYAAFVREWMEVAGWDHAVVVGSSMGGRVALQLALDHPERVDGLVLVNSSGIRVPGVETLSPGDVSPEEFMRAIFYRPSPMVVRAGAASSAAWYGTMERLTAKPLRDMTPHLGEIRVPTLIVWGAHDRVLPPAFAHAFQRGIPGSRLAMLERAGHVPMMERPGEVNEAIASFLSGMRSAE